MSLPRQSAENILKALDHAAIVATTDQNGVITYVNPKLCEISGYSADELVGKTYRVLKSGHHPQEFYADLWNTITQGKVWTGEIKNKTKSGSHYWVKTIIIPFTDEQGKPYQFVAIRHDITERVRAKELLSVYTQRLELNNKELFEQKENFRSLWDSTFEGIIIHEKNGQILELNQSAAQIFNRPHFSLIGAQLSELFDPPSDWDTGHFETPGKRSDGSSVTLELWRKPYFYQGREVCLTSIRDVSERKQLEAHLLFQDRLASVGLLASSLAHEIGTPLGVIRGRAEYLTFQAQDNPEITKNADIIVSQIDRVSKLIRSLLNLARGSGTTGTLSEIYLNQSISDVLDLMGHEFRKNEIKLINELESHSPVIIHAEAGPLHQVLLNLMVNAVHAIESSKLNAQDNEHFIRIGIKQGQQWELSIQDSGCGISKDNMRKLFQPFFTTKEIGKGTGLGLATSYRIIESWGGSIRVESQPNEGTTFTIHFPVQNPPKVYL